MEFFSRDGSSTERIIRDARAHVGELTEEKERWYSPSLKIDLERGTQRGLKGGPLEGHSMRGASDSVAETKITLWLNGWV